jgi:ribonuclease E
VEAGGNQTGDVASDEGDSEPNGNASESAEIVVTTLTPQVEAAPVTAVTVVAAAAADVAPVVVAPEAVDVAEVVARAPIVAPVVVTEPVAVATAPAAPAAPIVVQTAPSAPVAQASLFEIAGTLNQVGLELVQTRSDAPRAAIETPAPQLGRKPKASVVIASEPLQMVETRNE